MRTAVLALVLAFVLLATATMLARSPDLEARAERYFTKEEIARGQRHSFERRLVFWGFEAVELAVLLSLALGGGGARLAALGSRWTGGRFFPIVLAVAAGCFLAQELATFPLNVYGGWANERAWGLTSRSFVSWLADHLMALGVAAVIGAPVMLAFYGILRAWPQRWWILAGAGSGILGILLAFVAPILISPLFNTFVPLATTAHAVLLPRITALTERGGVPVHEVLVMDASRQGRHTNAYFTGFGATRRIVLYDTLLDRHRPEEVESILGHEIGHWRHHHIAKGLALGTAGAFLGLFVLARLLTAAVGHPALRLAAVHDPAGLPLILLLVHLGGWVSLPVENAISRAFEHEADRAALELAGQPDVFIESEKRLALDNISNVAPSRLNVWLFATHPPAIERIEAAERWRAESR